MREQGFFRGSCARCHPRTLSHTLQQVVESSCQSRHTPRGCWTAHFWRASLTYLQCLQFQTFLKVAWLPHRVEQTAPRGATRQRARSQGALRSHSFCLLVFPASWVGSVFLCSHTWAVPSPGRIRVSREDVTGSFYCCCNGCINLYLMGHSAIGHGATAV